MDTQGSLHFRALYQALFIALAGALRALARSALVTSAAGPTRTPWVQSGGFLVPDATQKLTLVPIGLLVHLAEPRRSN